MKLSKQVIALIVIFLSTICGCATLLLYNRYYIVEIDKYDMDLEAKLSVGINVDSDAIHFGGVRPGGMSKRIVEIGNDFGFPVRVVIVTDGELSPYVSVSSNNFLLHANESESVEFIASPPGDLPYGNYTGTVKFIFKRVMFS